MTSTGSDLTQVIDPNKAKGYQLPLAAKLRNGYDVDATDAYIKRLNEALDAAMGGLENARRALAVADTEKTGLQARLKEAEEERETLRHRLDNPLETVGRSAQAFLNEAREQAKGIVDKANAQARDIVGKAQAKADETVGEATRKADAARAQAERDVADAQSRLGEAERRTAEETRRAAQVREESRAALKGLVNTLDSTLREFAEAEK